MTTNLKEAGCEEQINARANLWSEEQKSHTRLCMRVRLHNKLKPNNDTESCMINETHGWRGFYIRWSMKTQNICAICRMKPLKK